MRIYIYNNDILFENELVNINKLDLNYINKINLSFDIGSIKTIFHILNECCEKFKCPSPLNKTTIEEIFKTSHMTFNNVFSTNKDITLKFISLMRGFNRLDTKVIIKNFIVE